MTEQGLLLPFKPLSFFPISNPVHLPSPTPPVTALPTLRGLDEGEKGMRINQHAGMRPRPLPPLRSQQSWNGARCLRAG